MDNYQMAITQRSFSTEQDKYQISALARQCSENNLHVIDLPYRLSSWALDNPEFIAGGIVQTTGRHCVSLFNGISDRVFSFGVMLPLPHHSHELLLESHSYLKVKQIRY